MIKAGIKPREVDAMTLVEASWYMEGNEERTLLELKQTQAIAYNSVWPHVRKKINPDDVFQIPGIKKVAPRSGISKEEHLRLVEQYQRIKAKENDRTSQRREGVRIIHHSIREPR